MTSGKSYLLTLLTVILAFNHLDRLALGVTLQSIKLDLALTDTQLGLLTGVTFAVFYAAMGVPIARWADRGNRVTIITITTALWSLAVAMCAAAGNFMQLLLVRVGVAVGEAGCYPPALSLISDYFPRAERPRAVARYMLGLPLAMVIGNFAAGWLNQAYGWRETFVIIGLPGLLLAVLAAVVLKEPRLRRSTPTTLKKQNTLNPLNPASARDTTATSSEQPTLVEVVKTLWSNEAFRHLWLCFSVWGFFGYGILQWQPTFFVRSYGLASGELGTWLAVVYGGGGFLGTWLGGELASRYAAKNERLQLAALAVLYGVLALLSAVVYVAPNQYIAFGALAILAVAAAMANGPLFAATQTLVAPRMRAMSTALIYFFCNLIGMGLGPLGVGALSDALRPTFGDESLRYALLAFSPGYLWCAWHLWQAGRTAVRDVAMEDDDEEQLLHARDTAAFYNESAS